MRLGIDFGTSRTAVALVDRGNYPIVHFRDSLGQWLEWFPTLAAEADGRLHYGCAAADVDFRHASPLPSLKRLLSELAPHDPAPLAHQAASMLDVVTGYCRALYTALTTESDLPPIDGPLEALIAVPAGAGNNQRYLTMEAFRRAGFHVLGMMNEPSAAGIEYSHQYLRQVRGGRRENLAVYDLGAGTFDTAVLRIADLSHEVAANEGIERLGGDDFDEILMHLALEQAGLPLPQEGAALALLRTECREAKERLRPQSKRITLDFSAVFPAAEVVSVWVGEYYERLRPLVQRTLEALERALYALPRPDEAAAPPQPAAIYLVGGSSNLPLVEWEIRERYGRRVRKSAYPHAATAIGLAIAADPESGFCLSERLTRHFGVWREEAGGSGKVFDCVFRRETPLTGEQELLEVRRYHPRHNIGHLRFIECSHLLGENRPEGTVRPLQEIFFPYARELRGREDFRADEVRPLAAAAECIVEERYTCDNAGLIRLEIIDTADGFRRRFTLNRSTR